jgi:hypothetical protein
VNEFTKITQDFTLQDWGHLLDNSGMLKSIYVHDPALASVRHPKPQELDWRIAFVLSRYNRKHLLQSNALPNLVSVLKGWKHFSDKVRWRHHLKDEPPSSNSMQSAVNFRCPHRAVRPCSMVDPHVEQWLDTMRDAFANRVDLVMRRARCGQRWSNYRTIDRVAIKLLKSDDSKYAIFANDKEAGYSLVLRDGITSMLDIALTSAYQEVSCCPTKDLAMRQYISIARDLSTSFGQRLFSELMEMRLGRVSAALSMQVKTHKPDGAVKCRLLHNGSVCFSKPLGYWLAALISPIVRRLPTLAFSSRHVIQMLRATKVGEDDLLLRIDLKDFYLTGAHASMVEAVSEMVDWDSVDLPEASSIRSARKATIRAVEFLLGNQWAQHNGRHFQVVCGAGIGLTHSGDLADLAFWHSVEQHLCGEAAYQQAGIKLYTRYRDDILLITSGGDRFWNWLRSYKQSSKKHGYTITIEDMSRIEVDMLDFTVYKGPKWRITGNVDTKVKFKATSLAAPLTRQSAHHPRVHGWALAELQRFASLSSSQEAYDEARAVLIQRMKPYDADIVSSLRRCNAFFNHQFPCASRGDVRKSNKSGNFHVVRLVLPYHPIFARAGFLKLLNTVSNSYRVLLTRAFKCTFHIEIQIAWCNAVRPIGLVLRGIGR